MAWDPAWEDVFRGQAWGKYPSEDVVRFVARNFYQVPNRGAVRILEVGCGTGANLCYIANEGFQAYGIDGSGTAIELCRKQMNTAARQWSGELSVADASSLPYGDNVFDAAIDNECIYANSYKDSRSIYREVHRVLKPNGRLFSKMFSTGSAGDGTGVQIAANTWLVEEGPLAHKGISRFTSETEIKELIAPLHIISVDRVSRTDNNRTIEIIEWIVYAEKR